MQTPTKLLATWHSLLQNTLKSQFQKASYQPLTAEEMSVEDNRLDACTGTQGTHRDTSNTNQGDSDQEDSQASNPGGEQLPQHSGGQEGDESGGK